MENIQEVLRENIKALISNAKWHYTNAEVAKHLMATCRSICKDVLDIEIGFHPGTSSREEQTLSNFYTDQKVIEKLKEETMGSGLTRYFATDNDSNSKFTKMMQQLEYGSSPEFDADMTHILKSKNVPEEIFELQIQLSKAVFMNPENDKITSRPDATCIIDSLVCPVELLTSEKASEMLKVASLAEIKDRSSKSYNEVVESIKSMTEERYAARKSRKAGGNSKRKASRTRDKIDTHQMDSDEDFDPNKRGRSNIKKKTPTVRLLSKPTNEEKKQRESRSKSIKQRARRYVEHLHFIKGFNSLGDSKPKHLAEKFYQLYTQMYTLRVSKGLLMYWHDDCVYYEIVSMPKEYLTQIGAITRNFTRWMRRNLVCD